MNKVNIDLEEIKKNLHPFCAYRNNQNKYFWNEYLDNTPEKIYKDTPIFSIDLNKKSKESKEIILLGGNSKAYGWYCFGEFTYGYKRKSDKSRIVFTSILNKTPQEQINNYCWATPEIINYWLNALWEESGLDYYYKIDVRGEEIWITYDFKELNRLQMKLVLFWTRYLFEYPDSLCMLDSIILKQNYYPDELLFNLLTLTSNCQVGNRVRINPGQCISIFGNFVSPEYLQAKLNSSKVRSVNAIPGYGLKSNKKIFTGISTMRKVKESKIYPIQDWLDNTKRFDTYTQFYSVLKKSERKLPTPPETVVNA